MWWFVDPTGKPFISKGADVVNPYGDSDANGNAPFGDTIRARYVPLIYLSSSQTKIRLNIFII